MTTSPSSAAVAETARAFADVAHLHEECGCFGARIDLLGTYSGEPAIVEVKTGAKLQPTFPLQLAGQTVALVHGEPQRGAREFQVQRMVLRLGSDGRYLLTRYNAPGDYHDFSVVRAAARVAWWRLRFDAKARKLAPHDHALYREDGTQVPGIGTVLGLAGLVDLRDIPPHILEVAADKGQKVHEAIQFFCDGDLDWPSLDPALRGYVESFMRFLDATGFRVEACEREVIYDCQR